MPDMDFQQHNREVCALWEAFYRGEAYRVPMILGFSTRYFMLLPETNPRGVSYREYCGDPELMLRMQLEFEYYKAVHILSDREMGVPAEGWETTIDFQNVYDAGWLGSPIRYEDGNVPATDPFLHDDNKQELFYKGIPDPFSGLLGTTREYYERMQPRLKDMTYRGAPVRSFYPHHTLGTDGPFTVACDIRGATEFCTDIYEDPDYAAQLLSFVTDAMIAKIKAWRRYLGLPERSDTFFFADDSIALLSGAMYEELVLPMHQKLVQALTTEGAKISIHLCGDATRHFKTLADKLGVVSFDTGFPVAHGDLVFQLGPGIVIQGGPHVELLRTGTAEAVAAEAKRILLEVKDKTRRFVLRDANNVAPGTPLENLRAMYDACREWGRLEGKEIESV